MPQGHGQPYTFDYKDRGDGTLHFHCSTDPERWPWLTHATRHPLVVQTQNFWASYGALLFEGGLRDGQWSALTWTDWQIGDPQATHAVRGVYRRLKEDGTASYSLTLFDAQDLKVATMSRRGVVFHNRNFKEWRQDSKDRARKERAERRFVYVSPKAVGLSEGEFAFVAPLESQSNRIEALVTQENGMPPKNRVISGSGDHVNSTHFAEITRQALCLITGDPNVQITSGEMKLDRYVELGTPFAVTFEERANGLISFALEQLGKPCAQIDLRW